MKLKRDLHLEISRKLQSSVSVKVFGFRADTDRERVCLGTLHMPESYLQAFRRILELGSMAFGARLTVGGSYVASDAMIPDETMLGSSSP